MTELKQLRIDRKLTQQEVADLIGISLRSYISYENDKKKSDSIKYRFLVQELKKINKLDEEHGILTKKEIKEACKEILPEYDVEFCYLFGSYAKDKATELSDVDLLISTKTTGLKYYELVEKLREKLHKKIDLLDIKQLLKNEALLSEVLKEGIKIYG
ncbi:MAG: nucleotidyltransferase domain-containing protein [Lachnospiraceae bacterium]|nr:nucleotidyltransferase domain-containing protein [Lachnospiraceae bacterium]